MEIDPSVIKGEVLRWLLHYLKTAHAPANKTATAITDEEKLLYAGLQGILIFRHFCRKFYSEINSFEDSWFPHRNTVLPSFLKVVLVLFVLEVFCKVNSVLKGSFYNDEKTLFPNRTFADENRNLKILMQGISILVYFSRLIELNAA